MLAGTPRPDLALASRWRSGSTRGASRTSRAGWRARALRRDMGARGAGGPIEAAVRLGRGMSTFGGGDGAELLRVQAEVARLGLLYVTGEGFPQDHREAASLVPSGRRPGARPAATPRGHRIRTGSGSGFRALLSVMLYKLRGAGEVGVPVGAGAARDPRRLPSSRTPPSCASSSWTTRASSGG